MGDVYKLKHAHGSFTDFETGLVINREDEAEVTEPIGDATRIAIQSGRLVLVRTPKKKAAAQQEGKEGGADSGAKGTGGKNASEKNGKPTEVK